MKIPISKIKANPFQERKTFEIAGSLDLSIKKYGFWGSLIARKKGDNYEIAFGERRLLAAKKAGVQEIDLQIQELTDEQMMVLTTVENVQREEVLPLERAEHIAMIQKKMGWTVKMIGINLGIAVETIKDYLDLVKVSSPTKKLITEGKIGWSSAMKAEKAGGQELVKTAIEENLTQDDIADIKKAIEVAPERKKELITRQIHPIELETERIKRSKDSPDDKAEEIIRAIDLCSSKVRYLQTIFHRLSEVNQRRALMSLKIHNKVFAELHKKGEMLKVTNK